MRLECSHFFMRVVVEDPQLKIVRASHEPILPGNKFYTPDWNFCNFKRFDDSTRFMVVDIDRTIV